HTSAVQRVAGKQIDARHTQVGCKKCIGKIVGVGEKPPQRQTQQTHCKIAQRACEGNLYAVGSTHVLKLSVQHGSENTDTYFLAKVSKFFCHDVVRRFVKHHRNSIQGGKVSLSEYRCHHDQKPKTCADFEFQISHVSCVSLPTTCFTTSPSCKMLAWYCSS